MSDLTMNTATNIAGAAAPPPPPPPPGGGGFGHQGPAGDASTSQNIEEILESIRTQLELTASIVNQGSSNSATDANAQHATVTQLLHAILYQVQQLNIAIRDEGRTLHMAILNGFQGLQGTLVAHRQQATDQNRELADAITQLFRYFMSRLN
ncbi:unnamed protein product [Peniophora sp. CBMAI 1063]|nr:unnamed protein product [Peniophora sp. CBMAI 1063]